MITTHNTIKYNNAKLYHETAYAVIHSNIETNVKTTILQTLTYFHMDTAKMIVATEKARVLN